MLAIVRTLSAAWVQTYSLATEADTLLGVEDGTLPDERLDATGTAVDLVKSDLADDLVAVLSEA